MQYFSQYNRCLGTNHYKISAKMEVIDVSRDLFDTNGFEPTFAKRLIALRSIGLNYSLLFIHLQGEEITAPQTTFSLF